MYLLCIACREQREHDAENESYDPWGKSGAGAPNRDRAGKVVGTRCSFRIALCIPVATFIESKFIVIETSGAGCSICHCNATMQSGAAYSNIGHRRTSRRRTPRLENRQNLRTVQARIIRFKNTRSTLYVDLHCACMGGEYMSCTRVNSNCYMYSHSHLRHPLV